jgi:hypothetical protein
MPHDEDYIPLFRREARNARADSSSDNPGGIAGSKLLFRDADTHALWERVHSLLTALASYSDGRAAVMLALSDDVSPNPFSTLAAAGKPFSYSAGTRQIFDTIMPLLDLQRSPDREQRDYWILPLRELGLVDRTWVYPAKDRPADGRLIERGMHKTKSPNNAYALSRDVRQLLGEVRDAAWEDRLGEFIAGDEARRLHAVQARAASVPSSHGALIRVAVEVLQAAKLPDYELLYIDDDDNERVENEWAPRMAAMGLELTLEDKYPDAILGHRETRDLWIVDAVISDGEINPERRDSIQAWAERQSCTVSGFVTAYLTWKRAAARQAANSNIAVGTYMWIAEDGGKLWLVQAMERSGDE